MTETSLETMDTPDPLYQVSCYLDEQPGKPGRSNGVLREKGSGRAILVRFAHDDDAAQMARFLSVISARSEELPELVVSDITERSVVVQGHVGFADDSEIGFEGDADFAYAVV